VRTREPATQPDAGRGDVLVRAVGYTLVGITLFVLAGSVAAGAARTDRRVEDVEALARELTGGATLAPWRVQGDDGEQRPYWRVAGEEGGEDGEGGWVLATGDWAPDVAGYGGPLDLVVHIDAEGRLLAFAPLESRETPTYLALLDGWRAGLVGRDLFAGDPFAGVDTVTGATVTADAMLLALERTGRRFASEVLGRDVAGAVRPAPEGVEFDVLVLLLLTAGAIGLRYRPRAWVRRAWLVAVLLVSGLWLNAQYASHHAFLLLNLELPGSLLGVAAFLVIGVPVVVLLFGNVYCGWLCPFGAAQELMGEVGRRRWDSDPDPHVWQWGRAVKYVLLALVIAAAATAGRREVLGADPLVTFFSGHVANAVLTLAVLALLLSLVFGRFFCRNLCPAGAFLALLGRVQILRRFLPRPLTPRCDLGVRRPSDLDCISCDRCRHA
jgi:hypothetical protein